MAAPNNIDEFLYKFSEIQNKGWIKTHRAGPTGIGKTLEDLLEIEENNKNAPDFGDYELKAMRTGLEGSRSLGKLTLFTCNPLPRGSNTKLRDEFGYIDPDNNSWEKILNINLQVTKLTIISANGLKLGLSTDNNVLNIIDGDGNIKAFWPSSKLEKAFSNKFKYRLIQVYGDSQIDKKDEYFKFHSAYELYGFSFTKFVNLLREGIIEVEPRIGQHPNGKTHDHGTAFRIQERHIEKLFEYKNIIAK